jgi:hypothetical protein
MVRCSVTSTCRQPGSWLHQHKQVARATAFVLVIDALRLSWLNRNGRVDIGMQRHWFLIQTDGGVVRIILLLVEVQQVFHGRDTLTSNGGKVPVLMRPAFQFIFLSSWWMVLGEMRETKPSSTARFSSNRTSSDHDHQEWGYR